MLTRIAVIALTLCAAACGRAAQQAPASTEAQVGLDAPSQDSEPARTFQPSNDAARAATGALQTQTALHLPNANDASADVQEMLTLRGANGLVVEAQIASAVSPATQVDGQTLRALLNIPVEEPQTLVYRVARETKPESGAGLCGADAAAFVVVWEPADMSAPVMKVLGVIGGAPGAATARACPLLEYQR